MLTHSSILAREIPWTEEPGRLQSVGSQRGGRDLATKQTDSLRITCGCIINLKYRPWSTEP